MQKGRDDKNAQSKQAAQSVQPQVEEAVRFSLNTLLSITDKVKELEPQREVKEAKPVPANILDPSYSRPWWTLLIGLGGVYLGYLLFGAEHKDDN